MARPKLKQDATAARLDGLVLPGGAGWAETARDEALGRVRAMGLPTRRDEYWRYTDPAALVAPQAVPAAVFDDSDETPAFDGIDSLRLVFVDGRFDAAQSDALEGSGL